MKAEMSNLGAFLPFCITTLKIFATRTIEQLLSTKQRELLNDNKLTNSLKDDKTKQMK